MKAVYCILLGSQDLKFDFLFVVFFCPKMLPLTVMIIRVELKVELVSRRTYYSNLSKITQRHQTLFHIYIAFILFIKSCISEKKITVLNHMIYSVLFAKRVIKVSVSLKIWNRNSVNFSRESINEERICIHRLYWRKQAINHTLEQTKGTYFLRSRNRIYLPSAKNLKFTIFKWIISYKFLQSH